MGGEWGYILGWESWMVWCMMCVSTLRLWCFVNIVRIPIPRSYEGDYFETEVLSKETNLPFDSLQYYLTTLPSPFPSLISIHPCSLTTLRPSKPKNQLDLRLREAVNAKPSLVDALLLLHMKIRRRPWDAGRTRTLKTPPPFQNPPIPPTSPFPQLLYNLSPIYQSRLSSGCN